jgi:mannitol/fructose-specific phosphotransferase system IIA component (Ntr-type)
MLAILREGMDFQAIDDVPVRIIVLLLLPKNKFEKHIKTLASVARLFNNEQFRLRILQAKDNEEILSILHEASSHSGSM